MSASQSPLFQERYEWSLESHLYVYWLRPAALSSQRAGLVLKWKVGGKLR